MKQIIIARKDLDMTPGKLSVQVAHASGAFLLQKVKDTIKYNFDTEEYDTKFLSFDKDTYENWINDIYKKIVCAAKNKNDLMKVVSVANELGLEENKDFWVIQDRCLTELQPEEVDKDGNNVVTTCIGFRPLDDEICKKLTKKYQLYK